MLLTQHMPSLALLVNTSAGDPEVKLNCVEKKMKLPGHLHTATLLRDISEKEEKHSAYKKFRWSNKV